MALPALWIGLGWSKVAELPAGGSVVFGDSLLMRFMTWLATRFAFGLAEGRPVVDGDASIGGSDGNDRLAPGSDDTIVGSGEIDGSAAADTWPV